MTTPTPTPIADPTSREPLLSVGSVTAGVTLLIAGLVSFGLPISDDQQAALLALIAFLAPFAAALAGRGKVFAPATVARLLYKQRTGNL